MVRERIRDFFDKNSKVRDKEFKSDPILAYEQEARQSAIRSLLNDHYSLVLDAGCGNGRDFKMYLSHADKVIGVDFSTGMVREAKRKKENLNGKQVEVLVGDVTQLPFKSNTFDLIVCSEVLEHVPNWERAIAEFYRLLKPDGELIISTPNKLSIYGLTRYLGRFLFGSRHPYDRWKTYFEHRKVLRSARFKVVDVKGACYLPGDMSYYQPFRKIISLFLKWFSSLEKILSCSSFFNILGYMILVKGKRLKEEREK